MKKMYYFPGLISAIVIPVLFWYNTYGDFASLLNDMSIAKQETYAYDLEKTGHLFAVVNYTDPNAIDSEYGCFLCNDHFSEVYTPSLFDEVQQFLTQLPKEAYYIIFGFLLLLNISMLSIKERFQSTIHYPV